MTAESLRALGGSGTIAIAGPFAGAPLFGALLAALDPGRPVLAARAGEGAAAGAALLALMDGPDIPRRPLPLAPVRPARPPGLAAHAARWRELALAR